MNSRIPAISLVFLAACARKLPDHLRLDDDRPAEEVAPITDPTSALRAVMGPDPLARSPRFPEVAALEAAGEAALVDYVRTMRAVETGAEPMDQGLSRLAEQHADTAVLALTRGYRLRIAENQLLNTLLEPEAAHREVVALLTPLAPGVQDPGLARQPLDFLGGSDRALAYGERWVLEGWLTSPAVPVAVPAEALAAPQYDALRTSPAGRLIVARAERRAADATVALADLRRATVLALTRAAADRDAEQGAWADLKRQVAEEVGDQDPIGELLERAEAGLAADAGADRSAGGAVLAIAALRWIDRCPDEPCGGLDRVEQMAAAGRWDPEIRKLAAIWRVVALEEVVATLDSGRDTALFPEAAADLADALIGTGGQPLEVQVLRKSRPDAGVWLSVGRAVGEDGTTEWDAARVALGRHLQRVADEAAASSDDEARPLLERIARRAVP